jgi:hypothetical protein
MTLLLLENSDFLGFRMINKVWLNQTFQTFNKCYGPLNTGQVRLRVFFIYRSWEMALLLLENMAFLGFRMLFKVLLNQIFSNFNTWLRNSKYWLSSITVYFTFTVPELWSFFS